MLFLNLSEVQKCTRGGRFLVENTIGFPLLHVCFFLAELFNENFKQIGSPESEEMVALMKEIKQAGPVLHK